MVAVVDLGSGYFIIIPRMITVMFVKGERFAEKECGRDSDKHIVERTRNRRQLRNE